MTVLDSLLSTKKSELVISRDVAGQTPHDIALYVGNPVIIARLQQYAAELEQAAPADAVEIQQRRRVQEFIFAVSGGDLEKVKELLFQGVDANTQNMSGESALRLAAVGYNDQRLSKTTRKNCFEIFIKLLEANAIFEIEKYHWMYGISEPLLLVANQLLGFVENSNIGEIKKFVIERVPRLNTRNAEGETALHVAVRKQDVQTIRILLKWIPRLKKGGPQDEKGNTALHSAVARNNEKAIRCLIRLGFDLNAKNADGKTALAMAREEGHLVSLLVLLKVRSQNLEMPAGVTRETLKAELGKYGVEFDADGMPFVPGMAGARRNSQTDFFRSVPAGSEGEIELQDLSVSAASAPSAPSVSAMNGPQ